MSLQSPPNSVRTQSDLAKLAGVSAVTVHKALSNQAGVSERMRGRIQALAAKHGYRLNVSARAIRTGRFGNIALILSSEPSRSTVPSGLLAGVQQALQSHETQLTLATLPDETLTSDGFVPRILREWSADGLLINYTDHIPSRMVELIRGFLVPSVWINVNLEQDSVYPDDFDAGLRATQALLDRGHRKITFIDLAHYMDHPRDVHFSALERRDGYLSAMRSAGATPAVFQKRVEPADHLRAAMAILDATDRPTGVVGYAGPDVQAVYIAALKLGLDVPRDLSLVTFGGSPVWNPGLLITTLLVPENAVGRTAVQMLYEKIEQPARALPPAKIKFSVVEGQSIASVGA